MTGNAQVLPSRSAEPRRTGCRSARGTYPPHPRLCVGMAPAPTRRQFLAAAAAGALGLGANPPEDKALVAVTLDLEMCRNFPRWEDTHWDYEKGNLTDEAKRYAVEACRRVKAAGGVAHCFVVGRVFEQADVGWLQQLARDGHPIGNHTYDHVNVLATKLEDVQYRFARAPWLVAGRTPEQVIVENVRLTTAALKARVGVDPAGFRTPGGFAGGLADRPDVRRWLRDLGFRWVSSRYPAHPAPEPGREPTAAYLDAIVRAQESAQPFVYPDGLVEVPMSPVSDIVAFRTGRWQLDWFLRAVRRGVEWAIEHRAAFDFLGHPACLSVVDPQFQTIDLICDLVRQARGQARIVGLDALAARATARP
jgi:peptidoglycan/xylan/chitin deacetylase (PgdA/CDA1 family)